MVVPSLYVLCECGCFPNKGGGGFRFVKVKVEKKEWKVWRCVPTMNCWITIPSQAFWDERDSIVGRINQGGQVDF